MGDQLADLMANVAIGRDLEIIDHDVSIIVECSRLSAETGVLHMCPFHMCRLKKGQYQNPTILYDDIRKVLGTRGMLVELLELMPYIDDYIGYFCNNAS